MFTIGQTVVATFPSGNKHEGEIVSVQDGVVFVRFSEGHIHQVPFSKVVVVDNRLEVFENFFSGLEERK